MQDFVVGECGEQMSVVHRHCFRRRHVVHKCFQCFSLPDVVVVMRNQIFAQFIQLVDCKKQQTTTVVCSALAKLHTLCAARVGGFILWLTARECSCAHRSTVLELSTSPYVPSFGNARDVSVVLERKGSACATARRSPIGTHA